MVYHIIKMGMYLFGGVIMWVELSVWSTWHYTRQSSQST